MKIAILHVGDLENLALGGVDQYIKTLIRHKGNNEIIVYGTCIREKYELGIKYTINKDNLQYSFIAVSDDSIRPLTKGYLKNEHKYIKSILEADVIYSQRIELTIPFAFSRKAREKIIQIIHGSSYYTTLHWGKVKSWLYRKVEKLSISIAKKTLVVLMRNEFGVPYYERNYKKYKDRIQYAKIPINTDIYCNKDKIICKKELDIPLDKFIVMYGGRVEDNPKRVLLFPQILKNLNKDANNYFFVIVGNGSDLSDLENLFEKENDKATYRITGYLEDRSTFVKYINASDCNLNISEFEGTCTASLESVACGTPIVSTDAGDIRLFVGNGENGIIIPNEDRGAIIKDSVSAIKAIKGKKIKMNDKYLKYESKLVIAELLSLFKSIVV